VDKRVSRIIPSVLELFTLLFIISTYTIAGPSGRAV